MLSDCLLTTLVKEYWVYLDEMVQIDLQIVDHQCKKVIQQTSLVMKLLLILLDLLEVMDIYLLYLYFYDHGICCKFDLSKLSLY